MAENNVDNNSNIAEIIQAIIDGTQDYPDFTDNPPSKISTLLIELGNKIGGYDDGSNIYY